MKRVVRNNHSCESTVAKIVIHDFICECIARSTGCSVAPTKNISMRAGWTHLAFTGSIMEYPNKRPCTIFQRDKVESVSNRTLTNPMAAAFSRKHWRQISIPYLRIIPPWLAQTRLLIQRNAIRWRLNKTWKSHYHWREPFPNFRGRENQTASCVIFKNLSEPIGPAG